MMQTHVIRPGVAVLAAAIIVFAVAMVAGARAASMPNPCKLLSAKQVAALHVSTSCKELYGRPNPYYTGVTAIWGKYRHGSVTVGLDRVKPQGQPYLNQFKAQHQQGKSLGIGSWSRGLCSATHRYCFVDFILGNDVVSLHLEPPSGHPLATKKRLLSMAKSIAASL